MRELTSSELLMVAGGGFWGDLWKDIKTFFGNDSNTPANNCQPGQDFSFTSSGSSYTVSGSGVGPEGVINFDVKVDGSDHTEHYSCTTPPSSGGPGRGSTSIQ